MSDELSQLISVLNNPQGSNQQVYQMAMEKLQQLQGNAANWKLMCERFVVATDAQTKFFTLQNLETILNSFYNEFPEDQKSSVRTTILTIFRDNLGNLDQSMLINKIGAIFCTLLRCDYPDKWGNAFDDLFTILDLQKEGVLVDRFTYIMFSILVVFDEDMIEFARNEQEDRLISVRIKDQMRLSAVTKIVELSKNVLDAYATGTSSYRIETVQKCLKNLSRMFDWIDIQYVFHYNFIDLMIKYMGLQDTQAEAMEVFTTIIRKGMEIEKKVEVIETTNIIQIIQKINPNDDEIAMSDLPAAVGECIESIGSFLAENITFVDESLPLRQKLVSLLNVILDISFVYFDQENVGVSETLLEFMSKYISYLKKVQITSTEMGHIGKLCTTIFRRVEAQEGLFEISSEGGEFDTFQKYRLDLAVLFKNLLKLDQVKDQIIAFVKQTVDEMFKNLERLTVEKIEAPLFLFCQIANSRSGVNVKFVEEPFPTMLTVIVNSQLTTVAHPRIIASLMDIFVQYYVYYQTQPELMAKIFQYFLDAKAVLSTSQFVASRTCLYFNRFIERVKGALGNFGQPVLEKLIEVVGTINSRAELPHTPEDKIALYTCMSNLMAHGMTADQASPYLEKCFALVNAQGAIQSGNIDRITKMIRQVGTLSKAYENSPNCPIATFKQIFESVFNGVFQRNVFTEHLPEFHDAIIFLLHRTVTLFGSECIAFVDPAIQVLMTIDSLEFFERIINLAGQVLAKTKEAALALMEKHFIPISERVFALNWPTSQISEVDKQCMTVKYDFLKIMDHFFHKGLQQFFFGDNVFQFLPRLVEYWLTQMRHTLNPLAQKKAVEQLFEMMSFLKKAADQGTLDGNQAIKQFYGNLYDSLFNPSIELVFAVKIGNAQSSHILGQLCRLQIILAKVKGASFIEEYKAKLTQSKVPGDWLDPLVERLSTGEHKILEEGYKQLISSSR